MLKVAPKCFNGDAIFNKRNALWSICSKIVTETITVVIIVLNNESIFQSTWLRFPGIGRGGGGGQKRSGRP